MKKLNNFARSFANCVTNITTYIANVIPTFLSVIAGVAITLFLATSYDVTNSWWYPLLLAGVVGLSAVLLPLLCKCNPVFYSYISTGVAILSIMVLDPFLKSVFINIDLGTRTTLLFIVALATDAYVHGFKAFHLGEFVLDFLISLATAYLIGEIVDPLAELAILIIAFVAIIKYDIHIVFSLKNKTPVKKTVEDNVDTPKE